VHKMSFPPDIITLSNLNINMQIKSNKCWPI
jgi:hypothetical protein